MANIDGSITLHSFTRFIPTIVPILTKFDPYYSQSEIPTFILCNPNRDQLYAMGGISERRYSPRFNAMDELSFRADQYVNDTLMPYYDAIQSRRVVYVKELGYFTIVNVSTHGDGIQEYKEVSCRSSEVEFANRRVSLFEGTFKFYDFIQPEGTLLQTILDYMPGWSVGTISDTETGFSSKYRTFDVTDTTLYNFLMTHVEEAYQCVFKFDSANKRVSAYDVGSATRATDIYISYNNVIKSIEIQELTDELVTALSVFGGGDLDINEVNPLGTNTIYDFDYFKTTDWMSQELIDAITVWENGVSGSQTDYINTLSELEEEYRLLFTFTSELVELQSEYAALEVEKAALIQQGADLTSINSQLAAKQAEIDSKQTEVDNQESLVDGLLSDLTDIVNAVSLNANFSGSMRTALQPFIIESSYINENFVVFDNTSASSIIEESLALKEQAENVLSRISEPRYTFQVDSVNFLMISDFQKFIDQLVLGAVINLEIKEGIISEPILLGLDLNYDDPTNFTLIFGNRLRLDDEAFQFSDLMNEAVNASTTAKVNSILWSNWEDSHKDDVTEFISSALNASLNNVTSGSAQEIIIDGAGLRGRSYTGPGTYSASQIWIVNNMIAFTDDNWETAKMALGNFNLEGGGSTWGIVADHLVGRMVAGNNLVITNNVNDADVTFRVDETGATLINADLTIKNTSASVVINPTDGFKIENTTGSVLYLDIAGNLHMIGDISASGLIYAEGGEIGGWKITSGSLLSSNETSGMISNVASTYAFYAGDVNPANAEFWVKHNGELHAENVYVEGAVNATSGSFKGSVYAEKGYIGGASGWTITTDKIYSNSGNTYIQAGSGGTYAFYAGSSGQFRVDHNGNLTATNATITGTVTTSNLSATGGTIGGWTITGTTIYNSATDTTFDSSGGIKLAHTTSSSTGIIWKGTQRFIHNMGGASSNNTFLGYQSGNFTMSGAINNIGVGYDSLSSLTSGDNNIALGCGALDSVSGGGYNVGIGTLTLDDITSAQANTAVGTEAGAGKTSGNSAVYIGQQAGSPDHTNQGTSTSWDIAIGNQACNQGNYSIAIGHTAECTDTSGYGIAIGQSSQADYEAIAIGQGATASGHRSITLGHNATTSTANMIKIGSGDYTYCVLSLGGGMLYYYPNSSVNYLQSATYNYSGSQDMCISGASEANMSTLTLRADTTVCNGKLQVATSETSGTNQAAYRVAGTNKLYFNTSDKRDKKDIVYDSINGIEIVKKLKPAEFTRLDGNKREFGFIAQEAIVAHPHLGWYLKKKDLWGIGMEIEYIAVLTKAIQEQQVEIENLKIKIKTLEMEI